MDVKNRIKIEKKIVRTAVNSLFEIDGVEMSIMESDTPATTNKRKVLKEIFEYDKATVSISKNGVDIGYVEFTFDNGLYDVISSYPEPLYQELKKAIELSKTYLP